MKMQKYKFNNRNVRIWKGNEQKAREYLVSGTAEYTVDYLDDDDAEACFESVEVTEMIGREGKLPPEKVAELNDDVLIALNQDESLCRMLGR